MNLENIRKKIDKIDGKIVKLLSSRMELALLTTKFKGSILDKQREKELLDNAKKASAGLLKPQFIEKIFFDILEESKNLQSQSFKLAAFQGEHGAYSEIAIQMIDRNWVPIPCVDFTEVFEGIKAGYFDVGVVPIENSIVGAVDPVNDLLIHSDLKIIAEIYVPIHHCLLALPESDYREIRVVYSHPQVLEQ
ncbi:MAG: prephenate dehydratase domain-containing protein, partial [Candidatus Anstonellaceae archaeon]